MERSGFFSWQTNQDWRTQFNLVEGKHASLFETYAPQRFYRVIIYYIKYAMYAPDRNILYIQLNSQKETCGLIMNFEEDRISRINLPSQLWDFKWSKKDWER